MTLSVQIPDDMAQRLSAPPQVLERRALEAFAADEYRHGRLSKPDLRRLFNFETGDRIESFLKAHNVWIEYTRDDLEQERADLKHLGF